MKNLQFAWLLLAVALVAASVWGLPPAQAAEIDPAPSEGGAAAAPAAEADTTVSLPLQISKTDGYDTWYAGWHLDYRITITNSAPISLPTVLVTDTLPSSTHVVEMPAGAVENPDGTISWDLGPLEAGEVRTLHLKIRTFSNVRGLITNTVAASFEGIGPSVSMMADVAELFTVYAYDETKIEEPPEFTPTPTHTATKTAVPSATPTETALPTNTPTLTPTPEPTATETATPPRRGLQLPLILK